MGGTGDDGLVNEGGFIHGMMKHAAGLGFGLDGLWFGSFLVFDANTRFFLEEHVQVVHMPRPITSSLWRARRTAFFFVLVFLLCNNGAQLGALCFIGLVVAFWAGEGGHIWCGVVYGRHWVGHRK